MPTEVLKMNWTDLLICIRCIISRGDRLKQAMRKTGKDEMVFPVISMTDIIDTL